MRARGECEREVSERSYGRGERSPSALGTPAGRFEARRAVPVSHRKRLRLLHLAFYVHYSRRNVLSGLSAGVCLGAAGPAAASSFDGGAATSTGPSEQTAADADSGGLDLDAIVPLWRTTVPDLEDLYDVRRLDDGFALAGTTSVGSGESSSQVGFVARLAPDGTTEWTAEYDGEVTAGADDRLSFLDALPAGDGLIAVGRYQHDSGGEPQYEPVYVGYDDEGAIEWSRHVTQDTYGYTVLSAPRPDGGFAVLTERQLARNVPDPELRAFTSDGALDFGAAIQVAPERGYESASVTPKDVVATEDGPVVLCTTRSSRPENASLPDETPLRGLVVAYDDDGNERWRTEVGTYEDSTVWNTFQRIRPTDDGFVLAGVYRDAEMTGALPAGDYLAVELDENGEQRWFTRGESDGAVSILDVVPAGDEYLLFGHGPDDMDATYAVLLDGEEGTERRTRQFSSADVGRYYQSAPAHDGDVFVLGGARGDWDVAGFAQNQPPTPALDADATTVDVGESVTLTAENATDVYGIDGYQWDLYGNGTIDDEGETVTAVYDEPGEYEATVDVVDRRGERATSNQTITVEPAAGEGSGSDGGDAVPGFGVAAAIAGLGGAAVLRRLGRPPGAASEQD